MRMGLAVPAIALMAACSAEPAERAVPRAQDVAKVEQALSTHPCIGTLAEWERNYRLGFQPGFLRPGIKPDFDVIQFRFRHTGPIPITATRNIVPLGADQDWPDSPAIRTLTGQYNVRSGRLSVARCPAAAAAR